MVERRSRWGRKSNSPYVREDSATALLPGDYKDAIDYNDIDYNDMIPRDNVVALGQASAL